MFRKLSICLVAISAIFVAGSAFAQYCNGGMLYPNEDCHGNRSNLVSCCDSSQRAIGLAVSDAHHDKEDYTDAVSIICRNPNEGNVMPPSDHQGQPKTYLCEKNESMVGIACKDVDFDHMKADELDGCTPICKSTSGKVRQMPSADLDLNPRAYRVYKTDGSHKVVGIAYKDIGPSNSDRADCATIIYQY